MSRLTNAPQQPAGKLADDLLDLIQLEHISQHVRELSPSRLASIRLCRRLPLLLPSVGCRLDFGMLRANLASNDRLLGDASLAPFSRPFRELIVLLGGRERPGVSSCGVLPEREVQVGRVG